MGHWQSYIFPCTAALVVHAVLALFMFGGLGLRDAPMKTVQPVKIISASLVELKKPERAPPAVRKSKPTPKAPPAVVRKKAAPEIEKKAPPIPVQETKPPVIEKREPATPLLDDLLADEEQQLAQDQEQDAVGRYVAAMSRSIINRWNRPPSARNNMEVLLAIRLVPNGDVVSVTVKKSSGNAALDRSATLAVEKVGRFEMLQGMPGTLFEKHFRNIVIAFRPEDLRL